MVRSKPFLYFGGLPAVALVAAALSACGSSSGGGSSGGSAAAPSSSLYGGGAGASSQSTPAPSGAATLRVATSSLGKILVDAQGQTLYLFRADAGTRSACSGACASAWPPLRASGTPVVSAGLSRSKVGTTRRSDGNPQVTYNGHPLYTYAGDSKPGDVTGQGLTSFGAGWFVLSPSGTQVSRQP